MKLKNLGSTVAFLLLCVSAALIVTGCDEGMNMVDPIIKDPITDPGGKDTGNTGEMKQPGKDVNPGEQNPGETETPTITIGTVTQADDGSVTVSGTSTELAAGETVTITLGDTVTVTATTDKTGAWSVTVLAADAAQLGTGTVMVTATAKNIAEDERSFEHTAPEPEEEPTGHGIVLHTEADRIKLEVIIDVWGHDDTERGRELLKVRYDILTTQYGSLFNVETEIGKETFRRFVEYEYKKLALAESGNFDGDLLDQYYGEAYGFSVDFAISLVHDVYLKEKPEDKELLSSGWQVFGIGMEYLLLQIANPDASDEELTELLRESIRAGNVSIAS